MHDFDFKREPQEKIRPIKQIVAYYRVSEQEAAGGRGETFRRCYSFEAQQRDVAQFAAEQGATIIKEYSEIASGMGDIADRPVLRKAFREAPFNKATLVVGRQDRLTCNYTSIRKLLNSGIDFVSVDKPERSTIDIHFQANCDEQNACDAAQEALEEQP